MIKWVPIETITRDRRHTGRMAVPDYQSLMLPILEYLDDGSMRTTAPEASTHLANRFHLTPEDLQQMLPSGTQTTLVNRTHWAVTYMVKAGLLERPARARVCITDRGHEVVTSHPAKVDVASLRQYPEFREFQAKTKLQGTVVAGVATPVLEQNPEEHLYDTYETLRQSVEAELLDRVQSESFPWETFEQLVVDLLSHMGFGVSGDEASRRVTKKSGDDGIDGVIDEDRLGLDAVYIQAKRYGPKTTVGRPALQAFAGSLEGQRASKGVFITTSSFTSEAEDYVRRISRRIVLVDGKMLARLMYQHGVGVRTRRALDVKRVDEAYFEGDV